MNDEESIFNKSNRIIHSPPKLPLTVNTTYFLRHNNLIVPKPIIETEIKEELVSFIEQTNTSTDEQGNFSDFSEEINAHIPEKKLIQENCNLPFKMANSEEINRKIVNFVPEFSGMDNDNFSSNLSKFIDCAEWVRNELKENEKIIFDQLIKYRLTGEAYQKIQKRNIADFETFKITLNGIYAKTFSLDELHRNCFLCSQKYLETTRQFGHRITELLDEYITGYTIKYNSTPDQSHLIHLNESAVQTFKNGINNGIVKEKIITVRANKLEDIIRETEIIEKMLAASNQNLPPHTPYSNHTMNDQEYRSRFTQKPAPTINHQNHTQYTLYRNPINDQHYFPKYSNARIPLQNQQYNLPKNFTPIPLICNYCQKPNHTWDQCRTRIAQQSPQKNIQRYSQNQFSFQNSQQKNCTYCGKYGHNVTECRNKRERQNETNFGRKYYSPENGRQESSPRKQFQNKPANQSHVRFQPENRIPYNSPQRHNRTQQTTDRIEDSFKKLKIFNVNSEYEYDNLQNDECYQEPENFQGSDEA